MAAYRLSNRAVQDPIGILQHTTDVWGESQADAYELSLRAYCLRLAGSPHLGRLCEEYGVGLRRVEKDSHVIFYRVEAGEIVVTRILHNRRQPLASRFLS